MKEDVNTVWLWRVARGTIARVRDVTTGCTDSVSPRILAQLTNSVALVRELTIPTERPPLVGEVSANFCG
jgi:hypothetical protein